MDEQLERRAPWIPWTITSAALLIVAAVGYFLGAQSVSAGFPGGDATRRVWSGDDLEKVWALIFLFWIFGGLRMLWWGPSWRPHAWRYRGYHWPWPDPRDDWDEWHRQAHRRMDSSREPAQAPGSDHSRPMP